MKKCSWGVMALALVALGAMLSAGFSLQPYKETLAREAFAVLEKKYSECQGPGRPVGSRSAIIRR